MVSCRYYIVQISIGSSPFPQLQWLCMSTSSSQFLCVPTAAFRSSHSHTGHRPRISWAISTTLPFSNCRWTFFVYFISVRLCSLHKANRWARHCWPALDKLEADLPHWLSRSAEGDNYLIYEGGQFPSPALGCEVTKISPLACWWLTLRTGVSSCFAQWSQNPNSTMQFN